MSVLNVLRSVWWASKRPASHLSSCFAQSMNKGEYFKEIVDSAFCRAECMTLKLPAWFSQRGTGN